MPPHEEMHRIHLAVLWEMAGVRRNGEIKVLEPIELEVRWVQTKRIIQDSLGNKISVDATAIVDREIPEGSLMWLGGLQDLPGTSFSPEEELMRVVTYDEADDTKGRNTYREVMLQRYRNVLPTVVTE